MPAVRDMTFVVVQARTINPTKTVKNSQFNSYLNPSPLYLILAKPLVSRTCCQVSNKRPITRELALTKRNRVRVVVVQRLCVAAVAMLLLL